VNLALRDLWHNFSRFLLTCVGLGLLLGVVLSMIGIYRGVVVEGATMARAAGADLWVVESGTRGPFAESSRIPGDTREAVARLHGVQSAGSVTYQSVEASPAGRKVRLYVVGFELGRPGGPLAIVAGRGIARSHYEMVVDRRAGWAIGERVRLGRNMFTVVGLTEDLVGSGGDPAAFITLLDSQELQFELAPPAARRELARGANSATTDIVNAVVARVNANVLANDVSATVHRWKHLAAFTEAEQEDILTRSLVERATRQIGLFTVILMLVSTVIIALIVYTMTLDKRREIATLKLIGAPDRRIVGLIIQQALAMGIIGLLFGAVMVNAIVGYFPRRVVLQLQDGLVLAGIVVLVCLIASTISVRYALKIDPATALAG
jgi:putative ABC transport system permease protein